MSTDPWKDDGVHTARPGLQFAAYPDPLQTPLADRLRAAARTAGWRPTTSDRAEALAWLTDDAVEVTVTMPTQYANSRVLVTLTAPDDQPIYSLIATVGRGDPMTIAHQLIDLLTSRSTL